MIGPGRKKRGSMPDPCTDTRHCLVCGGAGLTELASLRDLPLACNVPCRTEAEALAVPRGDIALTACRGCGHVFNRGFEPDRLGYDARYENALDFSSRFRAHQDRTVERLVARYGLAGGTVVDIGCGLAGFLRRLCEAGVARGIGFDPGRPDIREEAVGTGTLTVHGRAFRAGDVPEARLLSARHVLEHLTDPVGFLAMLGEGRGAALYMEVPDGRFTVERLGIWDLVYEHVSYFTPSSLATALALAGLRGTPPGSEFGGQFLWTEASPGVAVPVRPDGVRPDQRLLDAFAAYPRRHRAMLEGWRGFVGRRLRQGQRLALWGAGSKGVTFLNLLGLRAGSGLDVAVDVNPRKAGTHIPGTGQRTVPPEALAVAPPDTVLVMNPEYTGEIDGILERLGIRAELVPVSGREAPYP